MTEREKILREGLERISSPVYVNTRDDAFQIARETIAKADASEDDIERLARALLFDNYYGKDDVWDSIGDSVRDDCRRRAKVMIEFMKGLQI